jgi:hypothetical protein
VSQHCAGGLTQGPVETRRCMGQGWELRMEPSTLVLGLDRVTSWGEGCWSQ